MRKNKSKKNPVLIIAIIFVVLVLGVAGFFCIRIKLLNTNIDKGNEYLKTQQYDSAVDSFNYALKIYPTSADAYLGLTKAYIGLGELEKARDILCEGIDVADSEKLSKSKDLIYDQVFATYVMNYYVLNLLMGESEQLTITPLSKDLGFEVSFSSSDDNVACVTNEGLVTAVSDGTAIISAHIGNETWGYRDVECNLTVGLIVTYFEEKGCEYVSATDDFSMPMYVFQTDENGVALPDGELIIADDEHTDFSIKKIEVSSPDVDGNITYTVVIEASAVATLGIVDGSKEQNDYWYYDYDAPEVIVADEYTGTLFTWQDLYGYDNTVIEADLDIGERTVTIFGEKVEEWTEGEDWVANRDGDVRWATRTDTGNITYTITTPKDYNGLVLFFDEYGQQEKKSAIEVNENVSFDSPRYDGSMRMGEDIKIVSLSDYINR